MLTQRDAKDYIRNTGPLITKTIEVTSYDTFLNTRFSPTEQFQVFGTDTLVTVVTMLWLLCLLYGCYGYLSNLIIRCW